MYMQNTFYYYISSRFINKPNIYKKETQLNDKILVRGHLEKITDKLPKVYYVGNIHSCDFTKLPQNYVIKPRCNYGGKGVKFIKNGINLETNKVINVVDIKEFYTNFKNNRGMNNDILIEEFLLNIDGNLMKEEYKFFVFGGKVKNISVIRDINTKKHTKIDHDINWNRVRFHTTKSAQLNVKTDRPNNLDEMIYFVEKLGNYYHNFTSIPFVRVDLYNTNKGIIFGEYTGGPNGGLHITNEYQKLFGKYWREALKKKIIL